MIYTDLFEKLQESDVRYLVAGGVAVNLHGILRATADLDLMIQLEDGPNVSRFVNVLKALGFRPRVPVPIEDFADENKRRAWRDDKGALMTFLRPNSFEQVDVFLHNPVDFKNAYLRRRVVEMGHLRIDVTSLKDLKVMKRAAGREKDLSDIKQIEKLEGIDNGAA